jgi:N-methylhydantoinase A
MAWLIGVDVGGTFTDFYILNAATGVEYVHKTPTTPENPAKAILDGLRDLCARNDIPLPAIDRLAHGTTVGTNALIQRAGGTVAVVTTKGFKDLLEIGRQIRPKLYDFHADHPPPLAPRHQRFEIAERINAKGEVLTPITDEALDAVIAALADSGAETCAVCLLFSFLNPAHERRIGAALRAALPDLFVSLSSEIQPEFREYERFSTALLNAYLQPLFNHYMTDLKHALADVAPDATVGINQSSGGLMSVDRAREVPIRTALSGPAAGAVGAIHMGRLSDRPKVITLDMGGTSADVCLIRNHAADIRFDRDVAGFPVRLPMVDINTVGAGGGSIAWFDKDGLLKVGPKSAGALPGPACYGLGGDQPTVSDANLLLGRLSPDGLLGGAMSVDVEAARAVIRPIADRLGFSPEKTAHGILAIVTANMVRAIRGVSVERGLDPREFTLMPFGGAGPLHAGAVARALDIREILVPLSPGILCAQGLVVSDLKEDFVRSARTLADAANAAAMTSLVDALTVDADAWFAAESVAPDRQTLRLSLDMRYVGQNFELAVGIESATGERPRLPDAARLRALFFAAHELNYGYANPDDAVEIINFRLTARGRLATLPPPRPPSTTAEPSAVGQRAVYFDADRPLETTIYDRATLAPGHVIDGPAVIEQLDATTLVYPGDRATVDNALNLITEVAP